MARSAPRLTFLTFVIATVVVIGGFAALLFVSGFAGSGPSRFSGFATTSGDCYGANCSAAIYGVNDLPRVLNVTVRWTDVTGGRVFFAVWSPYTTDCSEVGTNGTCVFDSVGGNYTFYASDYGPEPPQTVEYVGAYD